MSQSIDVSPGIRKGDGAGRLRRGLDVLARALAAAGLGYLVAALSTAALSRLLPGSAPEAVMAATLLSFAVYAAAVIWAFAEPRTWRVWAGLTGFAAIFAALLWLSYQWGPRV